MIEVLDAANMIFVMYKITLAKLMIILIYYFCKVLITLRTSIKFFINTPIFSNNFFSNFAVKLLGYTKVNNHFINLLNNKQLFYYLIYSLILLELEILKIYIKPNQASRFGKSF